MIDQAYESRNFVKRLSFLYCELPFFEEDVDNESTRRHSVQKYCNFSKFLISYSVFFLSCYMLSVVTDFFLPRRKTCRKVGLSLSGFWFKVVRGHDSALCFTHKLLSSPLQFYNSLYKLLSLQFIAVLEVEGELFSSKRFLIG